MVGGLLVGIGGAANAFIAPANLGGLALCLPIPP